MSDERDPKAKSKLLNKEACRILYICPRLRDRAGKVAEEVQQIEDQVRALRDYNDAAPSDAHFCEEELDGATARLGVLGAQLQDIDDVLETRELAMPIALTGADTSALMVPPSNAGPLPHDIESQMDQARTDFVAAFERSSCLGALHQDMVRLRLTVGRGDEKSPADLLQEAKELFESPSGKDPSAAAALLVLRESMEGAILMLMQFAPGQRKTKSRRDKVRFICEELGRDWLSVQDVGDLASRCEKLHNELSGYKQKQSERRITSLLFIETAKFLAAFLQSLDHNKLRSPKAS